MQIKTSRRPKSAIRARTDQGREVGVFLTDQDRLRIAALGRWYCLGAEHLARLEMPVATWNPAWTAKPDKDFGKRVTAVKRRLAMLARVEPSRTSVGPLVTGEITDGVNTGWFATRYGATAVDLPWAGRNSINPQLAAHAWMAADVGMQIERLGYRVLSERELGSKIDKHGAMIETNLESSVIGSSGQSVSKKPDLAVLSADERTFMAIEVEKRKGRALSTYTEKLRAYDDNPAVGHVWYLCGSENVANRVGQAADKVFGSRKYPLRIRVIEPTGTWNGIIGMETDARLLNDLKNYGPGSSNT